jgi:CRISPR system Cascade subunit CasB
MTLKEKLQKLMDDLEKNKKKPGVMADLRCGLIPSREFRAWPHIARNGFNLELDRERIPALVTAFAFACQPDAASEKENMGDVLRRIACGNGGSDGLTTFALRFNRILACETSKEVALHLKAVLAMSKTQGISINHKGLFWDLVKWETDESVRREWANHYFAVNKAKGKDAKGDEA